MTVPITPLPTGAQEAFDLWKAFTEKWQEVLTAGEDVTVTFPNNVEIKSLQKIIKELEILLTQNATALVSRLEPFATDELATAGNIAIRQMYWNTTSSKIRIRTGNETYEDVDKKNTILQVIDFENPATDKVVSEKALSDLQINFQRLQPFITNNEFQTYITDDTDINHLIKLGLYHLKPAAGKSITNLPFQIPGFVEGTLFVVGTNHIQGTRQPYEVMQYLTTIENTRAQVFQRTLSFTPPADYSDPPAFSDLPTDPTVVGAWSRLDSHWFTIYSDISGINSGTHSYSNDSDGNPYDTSKFNELIFIANDSLYNAYQTLIIPRGDFENYSIEISRHYAQSGVTNNAVFEVSYSGNYAFSINNINTNLKLIRILAR